MSAGVEKNIAAIEASISRINASIAQIERVVNLLLVKRPSRDEQAKMAGVSRWTLRRREKREEMRQLVNGHGGARRNRL